MITPDQRWSLPRGNTPVPSRWQATRTKLVGMACKKYMRRFAALPWGRNWAVAGRGRG